MRPRPGEAMTGKGEAGADGPPPAGMVRPGEGRGGAEEALQGLRVPFPPRLAQLPPEPISARPGGPAPAGSPAPPRAPQSPARLRGELAGLCGRRHPRRRFLLPPACGDRAPRLRSPGWAAGPARLLSARRGSARRPACAAQ